MQVFHAVIEVVALFIYHFAGFIIEIIVSFITFSLFKFLFQISKGPL